MTISGFADLFSGAGGTTTGALAAYEAATGGQPTRAWAINHWQTAVDTHTTNHPGVRHFCQDLEVFEPTLHIKPGEIQILWASPSCTHHSRARGGKPVHDQQRSHATCILKWADQLAPPVIMVENVKEFMEWGPVVTKLKGRVLEAQPDKKRKGEYFKAWLSDMEALGYRHEHRMLCSADYGDPTSRTRLFVMFVKPEINLVWPEPTHFKRGHVPPSKKEWVPARAIIDRREPSLTGASLPGLFGGAG